MTITLNMADPFYYGAEVTENFDAEETRTIVVNGDAPTNDITLVMTGGAKLINTTPSPDNAITISVDATLDVKNKKVNDLTQPALVSTSGSDQWFKLLPGNNHLVCHNEDVTVKYRPAYF